MKEILTKITYNSGHKCECGVDIEITNDIHTLWPQLYILKLVNLSITDKTVVNYE